MSADPTTTDYRARLYTTYLSQQVRFDIAAIHARNNRGTPYIERLIDRHIPKELDARILDIGCGHGALLHSLKRRGYTNIVGVETSAEQVAAAREIGLSCVIHGDLVSHLKSPPTPLYDVIVAFDVLEHFTKDELLPLLDSISAVLTPGGLLIVHVPNGEAIFPGKVFFGDLTHQTAFTHRSISQLLAACGFAPVHCYEDRPVPHGLMGFLRSIFWPGVRTLFRLLNYIETGDPGREIILSQNLLAVAVKHLGRVQSKPSPSEPAPRQPAVCLRHAPQEPVRIND